MAKDLHDRYHQAREIFSMAGEILGFDLAAICFDGPEEQLKQTRVTQPAIFVHSFIIFKILRERDLEPHMVAGHSLGEYSALCAAGAIEFEDALRVVKVRAELMQKAGEIRPGTMAAIIGLDFDSVNRVCEEANAVDIVAVANYNSPIQVVVSGSVGGVEKAVQLAQEKGAKRVIPLVVSGAFHSPLMEFARDGLSEALQQTGIQEAQVPVYTNVTAEPVRDAETIRELLLEQLTHPVRWATIIENMIRDGAAEFYELGPGAVLSGLLKRIDRSALAVPVATIENLELL